MVDPRNFQFSGASFVLTLTAALVVVVIYLTVAWATTGRTWGSHVMGLRVVDRKGRRLRPTVSLLRGLFCAFFPIGLVWCGFNPSRRSVQDIVLRTSVVYDWVPRRALSPAPAPPTA
jgi:uncharacterized RDD family membrane protein YckC